MDKVMKVKRAGLSWLLAGFGPRGRSRWYDIDAVAF